MKFSLSKIIANDYYLQLKIIVYYMKKQKQKQDIILIGRAETFNNPPYTGL